MLRWALGFFAVALFAAIFGFTEISAGAASIAKVLFFLFILAFILCALTGVHRRRRLVIRIRTPRTPPAR